MHVPALHSGNDAATAAADGDVAGEVRGMEADTSTPPTVSDPADAVQKMAETVWMFVDKLS